MSAERERPQTTIEAFAELRRLFIELFWTCRDEGMFRFMIGVWVGLVIAFVLFWLGLLFR